MDEISTYSISRLQKAFELTPKNKGYFFVGTGAEPIYADEPFRTETYSIVLLKKGSMNLQAGLTSHMVSAPAIITIGPTIIRTFERTEDKPEMEILFFTDSFLLENRTNI